MVTVPHKMVGLERMLDCRGVGLQRCRIAEVSDCRGVGLQRCRIAEVALYNVPHRLVQ